MLESDKNWELTSYRLRELSILINSCNSTSKLNGANVKLASLAFADRRIGILKNKFHKESKTIMESRLPKPTGLKRPTQAIKPILPTERIKAATSANLIYSGSTTIQPLTRDLQNIPQALKQGGIF